jgi:hypothetical protein
MITDIKNIIRDVALRHKGVRSFYYKGEDLINAQNDHEYFQVVLDDVSLHELNITTNIFTVNLDIYVLGFVGSDKTVDEVQTSAYTIAVDIVAWMDNKIENVGVHDYSFLTVSRFTDDNAAGVKISLELWVPSPLNLCEYEDNFNDEPYEPAPDHEIDIDEDEVGDLDISVITLPRDGVKC